MVRTTLPVILRSLSQGEEKVPDLPDSGGWVGDKRQCVGDKLQTTAGGMGTADLP